MMRIIGRILKWAAISVVGLFALFIALGLSGALDRTPEERARAEAMRAAEKSVTKTSAAKEPEKRSISDEEARELAGRYGLKYTPDTAGITVTRAQYGSRWPYALYDEAVLRCTRGVEPGTGMRPVVTIEFGGIVHGLNGPALGAGGYADEKYLRSRTEYDLPKPIPAGPYGFIQKALQLCGS